MKDGGSVPKDGGPILLLSTGATPSKSLARETHPARFNGIHVWFRLEVRSQGTILPCLTGATPGEGSGHGTGSHLARFNGNYARYGTVDQCQGSIPAGLTGATPDGSSVLSPEGLILSGLTGATPYGSLVLSPGGPILPGLTGATPAAGSGVAPEGDRKTLPGQFNRRDTRGWSPGDTFYSV